MIDSYTPNEIVIIDVEASGLDEIHSYPIEIAWLSLTRESDSFLINPNTAGGWNNWEEDSAKVHNIPRSLCCSNGLSIYEACSRLNSQLNGCLVLSDAVVSDNMWIDKLFRTANTDREFTLMDIRQYNSEMKQPPSVITEFVAKKKTSDVSHRALDDCGLILDIGYAVRLFPNPDHL